MTVASEWSGTVGDAWASHWAETDRSFAGLSAQLDPLIRAAAPGGAGRAVDLGCGAGATSIALAAACPALSVTGADVSADLVRTATDRNMQDNLRFAVADLNQAAATVAKDADLLCSRHGVMFFDDPTAVFAALRAGAAPGARLVFSCFRSPSLNPWAGPLAAQITGRPPVPPIGYAPGPFAFADPGFVTAMLAAAGWRAGEPMPVDYPYVAGEGPDPVAAAARFFGRIGPVASALRAAPEDARPALLEKLTAILDSRRDGNRVSFPAAAWIWRATATEQPQ